MRYTVKELLEWGKSHSYPQLILRVDETQLFLDVDTPGLFSHVEYVRHGEMAWRRMARNRKQRRLAWKRVVMWEELLQKWAS